MVHSKLSWREHKHLYTPLISLTLRLNISVSGVIYTCKIINAKIYYYYYPFLLLFEDRQQLISQVDVC